MKKPNGYWKDWKNVSAKLEKIIEENEGNFPNGPRLVELGYGGLLVGIEKYQHGINAVRKKMGYELAAKPYGFWQNWENVVKIVKRVIKKNHGKFPTKLMFERESKSLPNAIIYFGGINAVRRKLGYEIKIREPNYWKDWGSFKGELEKAIALNGGEFPTSGDLKRLGMANILTGYYCHGGVNKIKKRLGFHVKFVPDWKKWKNVRAEIEKVIKENGGEFPSQEYLYKNGYSSLSNGIHKYHKGLLKVREKMGYELTVKPKMHWSKWTTAIKEMKQVIKENQGMFPSYRYMQENHSNLLNGLVRYHGTLNSIKVKMGYKITKKPKGYYKQWENVEKEMKKAIKENHGDFPSFKRLRELGHNTLAGVLKKYHGGYSAVREKMGYDVIKAPGGYYKPWEVFEPDMKKAIDENNGEFPTQKRLEILGYRRLIHAISEYHGGMAAVREKIGYNQQVRIKLAKQLEEIADQVAA